MQVVRGIVIHVRQVDIFQNVERHQCGQAWGCYCKWAKETGQLANRPCALHICIF